MNYCMLLAGGVGQRMRTSGMPKQFLEVYGKPIIIHTLEKIEKCEEIDEIIVVCNSAWIDYTNELLSKYQIKKVSAVISGGVDRQGSIINGIDQIERNNPNDDDVIVIHDAVRPLVKTNILRENVYACKQYGCVMTVRPVIESVIVTDNKKASFEDFKKRDATYSLTSPQSFKLSILKDVYSQTKDIISPIPLLDAALAYTYLGNSIYYICENNQNIKITTPEDYYILKAILELEENKNIFGLQ